MQLVTWGCRSFGVSDWLRNLARPVSPMTHHVALRRPSGSAPGAHTTMTKPDRAEINRRNAQKSTGPKTPEGKSRSRFNALKHGLTAKTVVLPGEDADAFQGRLDAWTVDLAPRNDLEQGLVERA